MSNKNKNQIFAEIHKSIPKEFSEYNQKYSFKTMSKEQALDFINNELHIQGNRDKILSEFSRIKRLNIDNWNIISRKIKLIKEELNKNICSYLIFQRQMIHRYLNDTNDPKGLNKLIELENNSNAAKNAFFFVDIKNAISKLHTTLVELFIARKNIVLLNKLIKNLICKI